MDDIFQRLIARDLNLRAYTAITKQCAQEITQQHSMSPNALYATAQSLTAAALLTSLLKPQSQQKLSFKISGSGPIGSIYIQADTTGIIRGYAANPTPDLDLNMTRIDFSKTIGAGLITLNRDIGMKEPYTGISPIVYGSVAKDTAYYLTTSEQIPSAVIIACDSDSGGTITCSGGILIQTFPDTPESSIKLVEEAMTREGSLQDHLNSGKDIIEYLAALLGNTNVDILSSTALHYQCSCNQNIVRSSLSVVSINDLEKMIQEDKGAEVKCTFCGKAYHFNPLDIEGIISDKMDKH